MFHFLILIDHRLYYLTRITKLKDGPGLFPDHEDRWGGNSLKNITKMSLTYTGRRGDIWRRRSWCDGEGELWNRHGDRDDEESGEVRDEEENDGRCRNAQLWRYWTNWVNVRSEYPCASEQFKDGQSRSSPLVYSSGVLRLSDDGLTYWRAKHLTTPLSSLSYVLCLLFLEHAPPYRKYTYLGIHRQPCHKQIEQLNAIYHRFMLNSCLTRLGKLQSCIMSHTT